MMTLLLMCFHLQRLSILHCLPQLKNSPTEQIRHNLIPTKLLPLCIDNTITGVTPPPARFDLTNLNNDLLHSSGRVTRNKSFLSQSVSKGISHWARTLVACHRSKIAHCVELPGTSSHVHLDIVGPLFSMKGFSYLMAIIDRFIRLFNYMTSWRSLITDAFDIGWVSQFVAPAEVPTDEGSQF